MITEYNFTKFPVSLDRLTKEIQESAITIALDHIDLVGQDSVAIFFKAELSSEEQDLLTALVNNHTGEPLVLPTPPQEVVTQFEKDDKILKLFGSRVAVDGNGEVTLFMKVPGNPAQGEGRYIAGGKAWFSSAHDGDKITELSVTDEDNLMGYGAGVTLRTWYDNEADEVNQGWYFPISDPILSVEPIGGYGFINSGLYIKIKAKKAEGQSGGYFYVNIFWARRE